MGAGFRDKDHASDRTGLRNELRDARTDQGLVADELEGEADQDWRKCRRHGRYVRTPNGGSRHLAANVPGDIAAHRGIAAAATTRARVRRRSSRIQEQPTGVVRPSASENSHALIWVKIGCCCWALYFCLTLALHSASGGIIRLVLII
jgi:hypothetical protein